MLVCLGVFFPLSLVLTFGLVPVVIVLPVHAQDEYVVFPETATVSSSSLTPFDFKLKAISKPSGDVEKVSGFKLDPTNVISILEGDIIFAKSTDQSILFERVKAKSSTDSLFELQKINDGFSVAGLAPGVYTLDMIAAKNNAKAAYEGILVVGQNAESQEVKQVVEKEITEVEQDTDIGDTITIFQLPPNPQPPSSGPLIAQQQPQALAAQQQQQPPLLQPGGQAPANQPAPQSPAASQQQQQQQQQQQPPPTTAGAAPPGTIPSCILTADCPRSSPPQALTGQQQQLAPGGAGSGPLGAQPQQLAPGGQGSTIQPPSLTPSPSPTPTPSPQALAAAQPGQCQEGYEGIPPNCTPTEPEIEPTDLLSLDPSSLDPNDPLFEEPGVLGGTGDGEGTNNIEDSDEPNNEDSAESNTEGSESNSSGDKEGREEEGDGSDNNSGDEGGDGDEGGE